LIPQGYGMFNVAGTHTYAHAGSYTIQVTIRDVGGTMATATSPMSVDDGWLLASLGTPAAATRSPSFTAAVDTLLDVAPTATPADLTAPFPRSDGPASTGHIRAKGYGGVKGVGLYTSARAGTSPGRAPLQDTLGRALAVGGTADVNAAARATTAAGGRGSAGAIGSPTSSDPLAIDPLGPTDSVRVLDEALASLGGATKPRFRSATP
jgi:hypothetical protein